MAIQTTEKDSFLALNDGEGRPSVYRENNNYVCLHHCCENGKCTLLRLKFDSARQFYAKPQITRQRTQQPPQNSSGRYLRTRLLTRIDSFDTKQVHHSPFISKPLSSCFSASSFIVSTHYDKRITAVLVEHVDGNMLSGINSSIREP